MFSVGVLICNHCFSAVDLAQQLLCQFGKDQTEHNCEDEMCPDLLKSLGLGFSALVTISTCAAVCQE